MPWIQYSLVDGSSAVVEPPLTDEQLAMAGKAQIFYDGNPDGMMVDITQNPPVVVPIPAG